MPTASLLRTAQAALLGLALGGCAVMPASHDTTLPKEPAARADAALPVPVAFVVHPAAFDDQVEAESLVALLRQPTGREQAHGAFRLVKGALSVPALGAPLILPQNSPLSMVSSGQMSPYEEISVNGIIFEVAADDKHQVAYVATGDANFRTPEGLSVGSTLEQVLATGAPAPGAERGWAYHTALPSGWCAAFVSGAGLTDAPLQAGSKVSWFFKRHDCLPRPAPNS